jgi:hypothetical protein
MKCKCKLDIVVLEVDEGCPIHKEVSGLQLERENILSALGEHPDSPVDIPQRVTDIRDEGRAHFHNLTRTQERLIEERGRVADLATEVVRLNAQLSSEIHRNEAFVEDIKEFREHYVHQDLLLNLQDKLRKSEEKLKLGNREQEQLAEGLSKRRQPLALNCTKCGSSIHTDSFHSERCPNGYR